MRGQEDGENKGGRGVRRWIEKEEERRQMRTGECSRWRAACWFGRPKAVSVEKETGSIQGILQGQEGRKAATRWLICFPSATLTKPQSRGHLKDIAHKAHPQRGEAAVTCNE